MNIRGIHSKYAIAWLLWAMLIFISSSIPGDSLPDISLWSKDKLIHAGIYAVLTFLGIRALEGLSWSKKRVYLTVLVMHVLYALSDEIHQVFVPNRSCEFYDWLADTAGILMTIGIMYFRSAAIPVRTEEQGR